MIKRTKISDNVNFVQHYCDKCNIETIYYCVKHDNVLQRYTHVCPSCKKRYYEDAAYPYIERINNKEE